MSSRHIAWARPVARLMLLVCTMLGVAAMHSFGHLDSHNPAMIAAGHHAPAAMPGTAPSSGPGMEPAPPAFAPCLSDGCAHLLAALDDSMDHAAWNVCLAVLTAVSLALLLAALLLGVSTSRPGAGRSTRRLDLAPRAPPLGLTLAQVSVLRI